MNANLRAVIKACFALQIPYTCYHHSENMVDVQVNGTSYLFINWIVPINPNAIARLCTDKDYFYTYFKGTLPMPKTLSFLNPDCDHKYHIYLKAHSHVDIANEVERALTYPLVVKKNRGSLGCNVFKVEDRAAFLEALVHVFNLESNQYDYVALVQDYIPIQKEYRIIYLRGNLMFAYEKNTDEAQFQGNLSPLHWEGATALQVTDPALLAALADFCAPLFQKIMIPFCGLDVACDPNGTFWLIEANASPGFDHFIRSEGDEAVVELYKTMLKGL